jgi:hypothetical protein
MRKIKGVAKLVETKICPHPPVHFLIINQSIYEWEEI